MPNYVLKSDIYNKTSFADAPSNYSIVVDQGKMIEIIPLGLDPDGEYLKYSYQGWMTPHEIAYTDEEFFWMRKPYKLPLKQGWNTVCVKIVKSYPRQNWTFTFAPVLIKEGKIKDRCDLLEK